MKWKVKRPTKKEVLDELWQTAVWSLVLTPLLTGIIFLIAPKKVDLLGAALVLILVPLTVMVFGAFTGHVTLGKKNKQEVSK